MKIGTKEIVLIFVLICFNTGMLFSYGADTTNAKADSAKKVRSKRYVLIDTVENNFFDKLTNDFGRGVTDFINVGNQIGSLDGSDFLTAGGIIGLTAVGSLADQTVRKTFRRSQSDLADRFFNVVRNEGEIVPASIGAFSLWCFGSLTNADRIRRIGRLLLETYALSGAVTSGLKIMLGRARPYNEKGNAKFSFFQNSDDYWSMPSGHTTIAFATATIFSAELNKSWFTYMMYGLAVTTGVSRIYHDKHWFSDVLLGAAVGTLSGYSIIRADKRTSAEHPVNNNTSLMIVPGAGGVTLVCRF